MLNRSALDVRLAKRDRRRGSRRSLAPLVKAWPGVYQPADAGGPPSANPRWILVNTWERGKTAEAVAKNYK